MNRLDTSPCHHWPCPQTAQDPSPPPGDEHWRKDRDEHWRKDGEWKRPCLGRATEQDGTVGSGFRDPGDLRCEDMQDEHGRPWGPPISDQVNIAPTAPEFQVDREAAPNDRIQMWSTFVAASEPQHSWDDDHVPSIGISRGRKPERVEQTRCSPLSQPVSRANSVSSVRSMIDERLEWAHQDRLRSASRDRSVPRSPFHEHSSFYAEFAKDARRTPQLPDVYVCGCCPKKPKKFHYEDDLRYANSSSCCEHCRVP